MPGVVTLGSESGTAVKVKKNFTAVTSTAIWGTNSAVSYHKVLV